MAESVVHVRIKAVSFLAECGTCGTLHHVRQLYEPSETLEARLDAAICKHCSALLDLEIESAFLEVELL